MTVASININDFLPSVVKEELTKTFLGQFLAPPKPKKWKPRSSNPTRHKACELHETDTSASKPTDSEIGCPRKECLAAEATVGDAWNIRSDCKLPDDFPSSSLHTRNSNNGEDKDDIRGRKSRRVSCSERLSSTRHHDLSIGSPSSPHSDSVKPRSHRTSANCLSSSEHCGRRSHFRDSDSWKNSSSQKRRASEYYSPNKERVRRSNPNVSARKQHRRRISAGDVAYSAIPSLAPFPTKLEKR